MYNVYLLDKRNRTSKHDYWKGTRQYPIVYVGVFIRDGNKLLAPHNRDLADTTYLTRFMVRLEAVDGVKVSEVFDGSDFLFPSRLDLENIFGWV